MEIDQFYKIIASLSLLIYQLRKSMISQPTFHKNPGKVSENCLLKVFQPLIINSIYRRYLIQRQPWERRQELKVHKILVLLSEGYYIQQIFGELSRITRCHTNGLNQSTLSFKNSLTNKLDYNQSKPHTSKISTTFK